MTTTLRLYNSLTKRAELFTPEDPTRVTFYSCGPTVYDDAHIGNFRSFLAADTLRRWLESPLCTVQSTKGEPHNGPREVLHVMNITDVGHMTDDDNADGAGQDKMAVAAERLKAAKQNGSLPTNENIDTHDPYAVAAFYTQRFVRDAQTLGLKVATDAKDDPTRMPHASAHVADMLRLIVALLEKKYAYVARGAVYFETARFEAYGALSGNTIDALQEGAGGRISDDHQAVKKHPADFLLWKADPNHIMRWDPRETLGEEELRGWAGQLAQGYPGWHIECSAMSIGRLVQGGVKEELRRAENRGQNNNDALIDVHSGGEDNIFPHHECEIAQSRCATGAARFARYWFHARHLAVEGEKMSKSKGNFYTLADLVSRGFAPAAIRLELIKTHYRSNANFTEQGLKDAGRMAERWRTFRKRAEKHADTHGNTAQPETRAQAREDFAHAMHEDLNVAGAIGAINTWINAVQEPCAQDAALMDEFDAVLGILERPEAEAEHPQGELEQRVRGLLQQRAAAKAAKDWAAADKARDQLDAMGIVVKDTAGGVVWERRAAL